MLIANLELSYPNYLSEMPDIHDLEHFYVEAKKKFDGDEVFKKKAYETTVKLQTGDSQCRKAWEIICEISRKEFNKVYDLLGVRLKEMGESFYDKMCREIIPVLEKKDIVLLDQGAKIIRIPGFKQPMMVVKSDGGLTYDTTDIAAINFRLGELKRDWVIYVIASEQDMHLKLLFEAAKLCGWTTQNTRLDHMGFGLVLNEHGKKIATKDGGSVKLIWLLKRRKNKLRRKLKRDMKKVKRSQRRVHRHSFRENRLFCCKVLRPSTKQKIFIQI